MSPGLKTFESGWPELLTRFCSDVYTCTRIWLLVTILSVINRDETCHYIPMLLNDGIKAHNQCCDLETMVSRLEFILS